eukprot:CAMPEP_0201873512 /NCGR_PEP_ID=MMETSP0902-20130614/5989_1 /ASSEMBLY_ACC=CAM_ASM_000551 /TAXON_ID=420261 /ORGANISM="Thalassiosira antarctica, Strain CCMP982" /LENGTH=1034 /DNA_ID=CAMNT_0048400127 /DNA_START=207 /DNA_END=3311 /DNA_ORIENTATION=+
MNPSKHRTRRRPRPRMIATAAAAAVSVVAISSSHFSVEAAFSTPSFTSRTRPTLSRSARLTSAIQGSASTIEDLRRRRRPLHHQSCHPPSATRSMYELLETDALKLKQSNLNALQQGDSTTLRQRNVNRRLGSLSGRYGGLAGSSIPTTSLSVSRTSNVLGFRVEDFNNNNNGDGNSDDDLQFTFEDFDNYQEDESLEGGTEGQFPVVRALDPRMASPTSQRVAASLLENGTTTQFGRDLANANNIISSSSRTMRPADKSKKSNAKSNLLGEEEDVPPWFPWLPTSTQINRLRVPELRAACDERDIQTTGLKPELRNRLLIWATVQDRKRVKDRLTGLKDLIQLSKNMEKAAAAELAGETVEDVVNKYDVSALRNKRKALTKEKKRSIRDGRGILGLVDETYFNATAADTTDVEEDEEEEEEEEEMTDDDNSMINEASRTRLSKTFNAPSSNFSNREVREMYIASKSADQAGDRTRSKAILFQLRGATPHDMRVIRRLARMEMEDGNLSSARNMLLQGLRSDPDNAHLWHGLGQLERKAGNNDTAKKYFRTAYKRNPRFANPYHALGTLEHTHGNIRAALTVIKEGIKNCPQNHRLYHALGDVYLDANMLDLAEESYLEGLQHGPQWSKSFSYTSLSFVSYAQGHTRDCRTLLKQSFEINGGMHAQGVIALAQLEESEGNIPEARKVYRDAISRYEKKRRGRSPFRRPPTNQPREKKGKDGFDTSSLVDGQGNRYSPSYSGDKWINVFQSWARMEEIHGTYETAHIVFGKAARLFPDDVGLLIRWAELQVNVDKARLLYEAACHRVGGRSAEPYRKFATFEMKRKNFVEAQSVLLRGAQAVRAESSDSSSGLARLFHTWGVCEYHLGSHSRAEQLFDDALRVTGSEEGDYSAMRSLILYSMARLEFARGEYLLAQHCIGLSLKENLLPGGNSLIWKLWSEIAAKMENAHLATRCKEQALLRWEEERGSGTMVSDLSRLLGERDYKAKSSAGRLPERTGSAMKDMFRKTPWYSKVCPPSGRMDKNWYSGAKLWEL